MLIQFNGPVCGHRNGDVVDVTDEVGAKLVKDGGAFVTVLLDGRKTSPAPASAPLVAAPDPVAPEPAADPVDPAGDYVADAADDDDADPEELPEELPEDLPDIPGGEPDGDDAIAAALAVADSYG